MYCFDWFIDCFCMPYGLLWSAANIALNYWLFCMPCGLLWLAANIALNYWLFCMTFVFLCSAVKYLVYKLGSFPTQIRRTNRSWNSVYSPWGQTSHPLPFTAVQKKALERLGLKDLQFKAHSFRIGAATMAALHGLSEEEIQVAGRWKSLAFKFYIWIPYIGT